MKNMSTISTVLKAAAPLALLALAGCAQSFNAKVSRFQQMPAAEGQSFSIRAADPALEGGLEFGSYAKLVSGKLTALGFRPAASGEAANLVVQMRYSVDAGREKMRSAPSSNFGRCFGYFDPWCGAWGRPYRGQRFGYYPGFYDPFLFGPGGFREEIESYASSHPEHSTILKINALARIQQLVCNKLHRLRIRCHLCINTNGNIACLDHKL